MSRIGKKPIPLVKGVKVSVNGDKIAFEGPKGKLAMTTHPAAKVKIDGENIIVERIDDEKMSRAIHGLTRALIANNVKGVAEGYVIDLEIQGVGYKAELKGKTVVLSVGFANQITVALPDGVAVKLDNAGVKINVSGADKQAVGQIAAEIRAARKPEPYQGKGIRYVGENVRRKVGKQFAGAGAK